MVSIFFRLRTICGRSFYSTFAILFSILLSSGSFAQGWDSPVMCWNVENYFDTYDDPDTADDEFTPRGDKFWSKKRFLAKRNAISKTILSIKDTYGEYPFLVGLVEVENSYVLKELVTDTPLAKLDYQYIHRDSYDPRGIECALLYREAHFTPLEVHNVEVERVYYDKPLRHILYVKGVERGSGDTLHIFVNHWSSKLGGEKRSAPNRLASALKVVRMADSIAFSNPDKEPNILIMGDLNDICHSEPLNALKLARTPLMILSEGFDPRKEGTTKYQGEWEFIDHFVVSEPLSRYAMDIYAPEFLLQKESKYLSKKPFRTYSGPKYLGGVSDHLPIILHKK
jgi:predicted extracellular nuclease